MEHVTPKPEQSMESQVVTYKKMIEKAEKKLNEWLTTYDPNTSTQRPNDVIALFQIWKESKKITPLFKAIVYLHNKRLWMFLESVYSKQRSASAQEILPSKKSLAEAKKYM